MQFNGISWFTAFILMGLSGAILYLLHLLHVRPRPIRVVTILFWQQIYQETQARTLWRRFHHLLTFLFFLTLSILLILALVRVSWPGSQHQQNYLAIIVDRGLTMNALTMDGKQRRMDLAMEQLDKIIHDLPTGSSVALIAADSQPQLLHRFDEPTAILKMRARQLAQQEPSNCPSACADALQLALTLVRHKPSPGVIILTDTSFNYPDNLKIDGPVKISVITVGEPVDNAGIIAALFDPYADNPCQGAFSVRVGFWGDKTLSGNIVIEKESQILLRQPISCQDNRIDTYTVDQVSADGGLIDVRLELADGLVDDNRLVFVLPRRNPVRIAMDPAIPYPVKLFLENHPAVSIVSAHEMSDIAFIQETSDLPDCPALVISLSGPQIDDINPIQISADSTLLTEGLDRADLQAGLGTVIGRLPVDCQPLLFSKDKILAAAGPIAGFNRILLSSCLLHDSANFWRKAQFVVFMNRAIAYLAGWQETPLVLTGRNTSSPSTSLAEDEIVVTVNGDRIISKLNRPVVTEVPDLALPSGHVRSEPFEWFLILAFIGFLIELWLSSRGKII